MEKTTGALSKRAFQPTIEKVTTKENSGGLGVWKGTR